MKFWSVLFALMLVAFASEGCQLGQINRSTLPTNPVSVPVAIPVRDSMVQQIRNILQIIPSLRYHQRGVEISCPDFYGVREIKIDIPIAFGLSRRGEGVATVWCSSQKTKYTILGLLADCYIEYDDVAHMTTIFYLDRV